jgi:IS605 OrfB family transposase
MYAVERALDYYLNTEKAEGRTGEDEGAPETTVVGSDREAGKRKVEELMNVYAEAFKLAYAGCDYRSLRKLFPEYNSQITGNAIYDARKLLKAVLKTHEYPRKLNPMLLLRKRDFRIDGNKVHLIYKPRERLNLSIFPSRKQLSLMAQVESKGARLVKCDKLFLNVVLEKRVELSRWEDCETIIGVDIGINYLAVCSALMRDGRFSNPLFFKGGEWRHLCDRKRKVTRAEEFKRLTRRQHQILHTVSKKIVEYAKQFPKPIIVMEKLGYFNNNTKNKRFNFLLGNWARRKLQFRIEYKAKWEGIPVVYVNPAYTSLYCHYCGSKGVRRGLTFKCLNCGRTYNADANASMNLAKKFRQLLDDATKRMTGGCSAWDLSSQAEGEARLPPQTHTQPRNGQEVKRMMVIRTLTCPLAVGGE